MIYILVGKEEKQIGKCRELKSEMSTWCCHFEWAPGGPLGMTGKSYPSNSLGEEVLKMSKFVLRTAQNLGCLGTRKVRMTGVCWTMGSMVDRKQGPDQSGTYAMD